MASRVTVPRSPKPTFRLGLKTDGPPKPGSRRDRPDVRAVAKYSRHRDVRVLNAYDDNR